MPLTFQNTFLWPPEAYRTNIYAIDALITILDINASEPLATGIIHFNCFNQLGFPTYHNFDIDYFRIII